MAIQILLSTYNGEEYLRAQLDSFLSLQGVDVRVLIRDDGSTDGTPEILKEYRDNHGFDVIFGENIGLNRSMYALAAACDKSCEYFSFADQDDVWLPGKLSRAVAFLAGRKVALYAGSSTLVNGELEKIGRTARFRKPPSFYNAMVENVCIGHTLVLTRALMDIYAKHYSDGIFVFDYWAYLIASVYGEVVFDEEETTLYRQHGNNVIGYKKNFFSRTAMRIRRVLKGRSQKNTEQLAAFLEEFGDKIPPEYADEAKDFIYSQRGFWHRFSYIFRTKAYRQGRMEGLIFRMMYLFGRYNIKKKSLKG